MGNVPQHSGLDAGEVVQRAKRFGRLGNVDSEIERRVGEQVKRYVDGFRSGSFRRVRGLTPRPPAMSAYGPYHWGRVLGSF
jgi:hypothetical protein